jgi:tRNA-dihydrouridine synthase
MQLYFAPLEGIGGYIYRNAQADLFPKADKYFSPFVAPNQAGSLKSKEKRDVAPENNEGITLIPQILTNNADAFVQTAKDLKALGYHEVNLNLGCPSKTVVTKYRGSGFLAIPEQLDQFLNQIFEKTDVRISIKTRLGMECAEEFEALLEIYNRYPLEELIIHPRVQMDYYKNKPHMDAFDRALSHTSHTVVYNGDLFTPDACQTFQTTYPQTEKIMLGRGVLCNPCLFGEVRREETLTKETLKAFHDRLMEDYQRELFGEKNVLFKMKELWYYMSHTFTNSEKYMKKIRKAQHLSVYKENVRSLFAEQELQTTDF